MSPPRSLGCPLDDRAIHAHMLATTEQSVVASWTKSILSTSRSMEGPGMSLSSEYQVGGGTASLARFQSSRYCNCSSDRRNSGSSLLRSALRGSYVREEKRKDSHEERLSIFQYELVYVRCGAPWRKLASIKLRA